MKQSSRITEILSGYDKKTIINADYSKLSLHQAKLLTQNGVQDQAIKRVYETGISIDGIESLDLDDAIWVEKNANGYSVFVHISDITEAVPVYTPLDVEALKRTTSIYRGEWVINMFPPELSQNLLSLNENGEKLTLSIRIDLDNDAEIKDFCIYESIFKNKKRHDYESFMDVFSNPEMEDHEIFQLMYEIARKRRYIRTREWANMNFDESDRQLYIWPNREKEHFSRKKIPSIIIEEYMILANICSAILCVRNKYDSIFRLHNSTDEKAYYYACAWRHAGLALMNYSHFTSPIRRYADTVIHRVLKWVHLRKESWVYSQQEIFDIAEHINVSRTVIDILGRDADNELKWKKIVSKLKHKNGEELNTSHFTKNIRDTVWAGKKIPQIIVEEIRNDLENGEKANWAWAIGVLLVWKSEALKQTLKKVLLQDKKFTSKSILSLLSVTKVLNTDDEFLFQIEEKEEWNQFSISVKYEQKQLFHPLYINYWEYEKNEAIGKLRNKAVKKIVEHFCWK